MGTRDSLYYVFPEDMGSDYTRLKGQLDALTQEKGMDMVQIRDLLERNTQLEIDYQNL